VVLTLAVVIFGADLFLLDTVCELASEEGGSTAFRNDTSVITPILQHSAARARGVSGVLKASLVLMIGEVVLPLLEVALDVAWTLQARYCFDRPFVAY
jgi:hypothetical protein